MELFPFVDLANKINALPVGGGPLPEYLTVAALNQRIDDQFDGELTQRGLPLNPVALDTVVSDRLAALGLPATGAALTTRLETEYVPVVEAVAPGIVADALDPQVPGTSVGYIERQSVTTSVDTTGTPIASMVLNVVGAGRPVELEWFVPGPYHSVSGTHITLGIQYQRAGVYMGYVTIGAAVSPSTTHGSSVSIKRQLVLDDGVTYTFYPAMAGGGPGTSNLGISGLTPSFLSAVSR